MPSDTANQLLDAAHELIEHRGFNAMSYADLERAVGIRKASIHHHFPTKADLGLALMTRYLDGLEEHLDAIDRAARSERARLRRFIDLYRTTEARDGMCLCGSMATDAATLDAPVQEVVSRYLARCEDWLARVLRDGAAADGWRLPGRPRDAAAALLAGLQGALLVSRGRGDADVVDRLERSFLASLRPSDG